MFCELVQRTNYELIEAINKDYNEKIQYIDSEIERYTVEINQYTNRLNEINSIFDIDDFDEEFDKQIFEIEWNIRRNTKRIKKLNEMKKTGIINDSLGKNFILNKYIIEALRGKLEFILKVEIEIMLSGTIRVYTVLQNDGKTYEYIFDQYSSMEDYNVISLYIKQYTCYSQNKVIDLGKVLEKLFEGKVKVNIEDNSIYLSSV